MYKHYIKHILEKRAEELKSKDLSGSHAYISSKHDEKFAGVISFNNFEQFEKHLGLILKNIAIHKDIGVALYAGNHEEGFKKEFIFITKLED